MIDGPIDPTVRRLLDLDDDSVRAAESWLMNATDADRRAADAVSDGLRAWLGSFDPADRPSIQANGRAWAAACLVVGPEVADRMRRRGVPDEVIPASLADVGRHIRLHRRHAGAFGLDAPWWMTEVLSGRLFQLGRLQFVIGAPGRVRPPVDTGPWVLHVHIPESGPLDPGAAAESFARAAEFFPTYFPDHPVSVAVCSSWLLDPYLAEHLAPESNIARFAGIFRPYGDPMDDENDALYFVFGRRSAERLDELPRRSSLQRLVIDRIVAGGRWRRMRGYRLLDTPADGG